MFPIAWLSMEVHDRNDKDPIWLNSVNDPIREVVPRPGFSLSYQSADSATSTSASG